MRLNTNGEIFPKGTYRFKVVDIPEKDQTPSGHFFYQFKFIAHVEGEEMPYAERFMVWLMAPLLRALGCDEIASGEFEFEPAWCLGKEVIATIVHEPIAKGPSTGKIVARMREIKSVISNGHMAPAKGAKAEEEIPF